MHFLIIAVAVAVACMLAAATAGTDPLTYLWWPAAGVTLGAAWHAFQRQQRSSSWLVIFLAATGAVITWALVTRHRHPLAVSGIAAATVAGPMLTTAALGRFEAWSPSQTHLQRTARFIAFVLMLGAPITAIWLFLALDWVAALAFAAEQSAGSSFAPDWHELIAAQPLTEWLAMLGRQWVSASAGLLLVAPATAAWLAAASRTAADPLMPPPPWRQTVRGLVRPMVALAALAAGMTLAAHLGLPRAPVLLLSASIPLMFWAALQGDTRALTLTLLLGGIVLLSAYHQAMQAGMPLESLLDEASPRVMQIRMSSIAPIEAGALLLAAAIVGLLARAMSNDRADLLRHLSSRQDRPTGDDLAGERAFCGAVADVLTMPARTGHALLALDLSDTARTQQRPGQDARALIETLDADQSIATLLQSLPGLRIAARLAPGRYRAAFRADTVIEARASARALYSAVQAVVIHRTGGEPEPVQAATRHVQADPAGQHGLAESHGATGPSDPPGPSDPSGASSPSSPIGNTGATSATRPIDAQVAALHIGLATTVEVDECIAALDDALDIARSVRDPQLFVEPLSQVMIDERRQQARRMTQVREAIEENRIELYAQPIGDPDTPPGLLSYEILCRLRDSDGALIRPAEFIELAQAARMLVALDRRVIQRCFLWLSTHPAAWHATWRCSINLSGPSIADPATAAFIADQREQFGIEADRIVFELAERDAIRAPAITSALIANLKGDGFAIALDDFGAGLSHFAFLRRFNLDYVKIDGSYVRNSGVNPVDDEIIQSAARVAARFNLKAVAEHVHTDELRERLLALGVVRMQGDALGAPVPLGRLFDMDGDDVVLAVAGTSIDPEDGRSDEAPTEGAAIP